MCYSNLRRQKAQHKYKIDSRFSDSTQGYINGDYSTEQLVLYFNLITILH